MAILHKLQFKFILHQYLPLCDLFSLLNLKKLFVDSVNLFTWIILAEIILQINLPKKRS